MKLVYEVVEDQYDDTTHIRSMTEQAKIPGGGWLIRTTLYTPHHIGIDVLHLPSAKKKGALYKPVG